MNIWASPPHATDKSGPCVSPIFHCRTRALLLTDTWAPPRLLLKPSKTSSPYPLARSAISNLHPRHRPASTAPAATKPPASAPSHHRPWPPPPSPKQATTLSQNPKPTSTHLPPARGRSGTATTPMPVVPPPLARGRWGTTTTPTPVVPPPPYNPPRWSAVLLRQSRRHRSTRRRFFGIPPGTCFSRRLW